MSKVTDNCIVLVNVDFASSTSKHIFLCFLYFVVGQTQCVPLNQCANADQCTIFPVAENESNVDLKLLCQNAAASVCGVSFTTHFVDF